jgi:hypothetical protein
VENDGVAKTPQLLRCAAFFVTAAYRMYASFLEFARLAFGAFCLAITFDDFLRY